MFAAADVSEVVKFVAVHFADVYAVVERLGSEDCFADFDFRILRQGWSAPAVRRFVIVTSKVIGENCAKEAAIAQVDPAAVAVGSARSIERRWIRWSG